MADMKRSSMKSITASDRKSLIRLAAALPKGSSERKALLNVLANQKFDFPRSQVDYSGAASEIATALRRSGLFVKVRLGRDRGMYRGKQILLTGDSDIRSTFENITEVLKPLGYKVVGSGGYPNVWGKLDEALWVDGEDGYDLGYEPSGLKDYVIEVRTWPGIGIYAPE